MLSLGVAFKSLSLRHILPKTGIEKSVPVFAFLVILIVLMSAPVVTRF
ncbi:LPXTG cell wall anchor domain-containing protein [Vibrio sinaloensis]